MRTRSTCPRAWLHRLRQDPLWAYLVAATIGVEADEVTAPPADEKSQPQWHRLNVAELEVMEYLVMKANGTRPRMYETQRLQLTIGPTEWLATQPGSTQLYRVQHLRLESVPIAREDREPAPGTSGHHSELKR